MVGVANDENCSPRSGSNRSTAFKSPTSATWRRSSVVSPRCAKRRARNSARRTCSSTSSFRSLRSPVRRYSVNFAYVSVESVTTRPPSGTPSSPRSRTRRRVPSSSWWSLTESMIVRDRSLSGASGLPARGRARPRARPRASDDAERHRDLVVGRRHEQMAELVDRDAEVFDLVVVEAGAAGGVGRDQSDRAQVLGERGDRQPHVVARDLELFLDPRIHVRAPSCRDRRRCEDSPMRRSQNLARRGYGQPAYARRRMDPARSPSPSPPRPSICDWPASPPPTPRAGPASTTRRSTTCASPSASSAAWCRSSGRDGAPLVRGVAGDDHGRRRVAHRRGRGQPAPSSRRRSSPPWPTSTRSTPPTASRVSGSSKRSRRRHLTDHGPNEVRTRRRRLSGDWSLRRPWPGGAGTRTMPPARGRPNLGPRKVGIGSPIQSIDAVEAAAAAALRRRRGGCPRPRHAHRGPAPRARRCPTTGAGAVGRDRAGGAARHRLRRPGDRRARAS